MSANPTNKPSILSGLISAKLLSTKKSDNVQKVHYVESTVEGWRTKYLEIGELEATRQMLEFILENKREEVPPNTTIASTIHSLAVVTHKLGRIIYQNKGSVGATEGTPEATELYEKAKTLYEEANTLYEEALPSVTSNTDLNANLRLCKSELEQITTNDAPFTEPLPVIKVPQNIDGIITAEKKKIKSVFTETKTLVSETFKPKPLDNLSFLITFLIPTTAETNEPPQRENLIIDFMNAYNRWSVSKGKEKISLKIDTKKEVDDILLYIKTDSMYTYKTLSEAIKKNVESFIQQENSKPKNFLKIIKSKITRIQHQQFRKYLLSIFEVPALEAPTLEAPNQTPSPLDEIIERFYIINDAFTEFGLEFSTDTECQKIQEDLNKLLEFIDRLITNFETNFKDQNILENSNLDEALTISSYRLVKNERGTIKYYSIIRDRELPNNTVFTSKKEQAENKVFIFNEAEKPVIRDLIMTFLNRLQTKLTAQVDKKLAETQTEEFKTRAALQNAIQAQIDAKFAEFSKLENEKKLNTFTVQTKKTSEGKYVVTITDSKGTKTKKQIAKDTVKQDDIQNIAKDESNDEIDKLCKVCGTIENFVDKDERIAKLNELNIQGSEVDIYTGTCNKIKDNDRVKNKKSCGGKTRKVRRKKTKKVKRKMGRKLSTRK